MVTRYDDVRLVLSDRRFRPAAPPEAADLRPVLFRSPGWPGSAEGADLARLRQLVAPAFTFRRIEALRPEIQRLLDALLDDMASGARPTDLHRALTFPLPAQVICALLGLPFGEIDALTAWSEQVVTPPFLIDEAVAVAAWDSLTAYFGSHLAAKRRRPADDLLSELATSGAPDDVATGLAIGLYVAGHETTVSQLEYGFLALFRHPEQHELLLRDPSAAPDAVEEILRMFPINPAGVIRYATEDVEVGGVPIPAGSAVMVGGPAAAFDPDVFTDPLRFDVTRSVNPHLSFGYGPHFCVGAALARAELQLTFVSTLRRFPRLRLAVPSSALRLKPSLAGGFEELPVTW